MVDGGGLWPDDNATVGGAGALNDDDLQTWLLAGAGAQVWIRGGDAGEAQDKRAGAIADHFVCAIEQLAFHVSGAGGHDGEGQHEAG